MFERTATDLFIFVIVLFLFILAFATTAFLSFSSDVEDFRSLNSSILNLVRYTVTDMDVQLLTNSSLIIGPIFFVFWSLLMILILANVFIAILSDAYNAINIEQKDDIIIEINRLYVEILEGIIKKYPEQYFWFHKKWDKRIYK